MRISKWFMYFLMRLHQLCCCCCSRRRLRGHVYEESVDPQQHQRVNEFESGSETTIDIEPGASGLGKINLDYHEDDSSPRPGVSSTATAATPVNAAAAPKATSTETNKHRATLTLQIAARENWLNDFLIHGERTVTVICSVFGPVQLEGRPFVDPGGLVRYTLSTTDPGVFAEWSDQTRWPSVSALFDRKMSVSDFILEKKK